MKNWNSGSLVGLITTRLPPDFLYPVSGNNLKTSKFPLSPLLFSLFFPSPPIYSRLFSFLFLSPFFSLSPTPFSFISSKPILVSRECAQNYLCLEDYTVFEN